MSFRIFKNSFKDDIAEDVKTAIEDDSKFTCGNQKMLRTFNSSIAQKLNRQSSLDRGKRSISS
jgi:hypothetical protein